MSEDRDGRKHHRQMSVLYLVTCATAIVVFILRDWLELRWWEAGWTCLPAAALCLSLTIFHLGMAHRVR